MSGVSMSGELLSQSELGRVRALALAALESGVSHLTLIEEYTGTTNVTQYFEFLKQGIESKENNVSVNVLDKKSARQTAPIGLSVNLVPGYRGKADIVAAIKDMASGVKGGLTGAAPGDREQVLGKTLLLGHLPEPDLMVFFDGRKMLGEAGVWIGAYAEFAFLKQSWQSFTASDLDGLLEDYGMRERRFGAVGTLGAGVK